MKSLQAIPDQQTFEHLTKSGPRCKAALPFLFVFMLQILWLSLTKTTYISNTVSILSDCLWLQDIDTHYFSSPYKQAKIAQSALALRGEDHFYICQLAAD